MDLLDRVAGPGADLFGRVDQILTSAGAPADHPVWRLMQRAGALPSAVLVQVGALSSTDLHATAAHVTGARAEIERSADAVPAHLDSRGAAADGFGARWSALGAQVVQDGLAERLTATSSALDSAATWAARTRRNVAAEVGACLGSSEAVLVRSMVGVPGPDEIRAAADIAAGLFTAVLEAVDEGWQHVAELSPLAHEVPVRVGAAAATPMPSHIELR